MKDGHEILARAGSLEETDPLGISCDVSDSKPRDTSSSSGIFATSSFSLTGKISDDEPVDLSPDAKLQIKVDAPWEKVKQHTADSASTQAAIQDDAVKTESVSKISSLVRRWTQ